MSNNDNNNENNTTANTDEYEKVCYICRRSESKAGKMINMPGGLCAVSYTHLTLPTILLV